jgi:D-tyrosyl-tRNA(Tyr) deacylase
MRAVIQRVRSAQCEVDGQVTGAIQQGLLVLLGIEESDGQAEIEWLSQKMVQLRIFSDDQGLMNRSLLDVGGQILLISQFTLFAQTKKGNRPSFIRAAKPPVAIPLYEQMITSLQTHLGRPVEKGIFGADMQISLINDGPVTIVMDTQDKERH